MYSEELVQFIECNRLKYKISELCKMIEKKFNKKITEKALRKYFYRHNLDYKYPEKCDEHMITVKHLRDTHFDENFNTNQNISQYKKTM